MWSVPIVVTGGHPGEEVAQRVGGDPLLLLAHAVEGEHVPAVGVVALVQEPGGQPEVDHHHHQVEELAEDEAGEVPGVPGQVERSCRILLVP